MNISDLVVQKKNHLFLSLSAKLDQIKKKKDVHTSPNHVIYNFVP